jgi:hypothetical protein
MFLMEHLIEVFLEENTKLTEKGMRFSKPCQAKKITENVILSHKDYVYYNHNGVVGCRDIYTNEKVAKTFS